MAKISARLKRSGATRRVMPHLRAAIDKAVKTTAFVTANDAKTAVQTGARTGRIYKRGGKTHQASAPGEAPKTDIGNLVQKIRSEDKGHAKSDVVAGTKYAGDLEYGTSKMAARPYMRPAIDENKVKLSKQLRTIMKQSVQKAKK